MSRLDTFAEWVDILTDFKNATPRLNLNIFWIKNSVVVNLNALIIQFYHCSISPENFIVI